LATQVLLPAVCLPLRAYTADVVGAVLLDVERGQRVARAATTHQVPVSTARRWVAAAASAASTLTAAAVGVAAAFGDTTGCWPPYRPTERPGEALTGVLHALGGAAAAWTRAACSARAPGRVGMLSGIDNLAQLRDGYQRELLRDLGVADPSNALGVGVTGWPLVNVLTGGLLLSLLPTGSG
jgi:hypothetical protein